MENIVFNNGAKAYETELKGCFIIKPRFFGDERGYYVADYIKEDMESLGFDKVLTHTESKSTKNILRGMEYDVNNALYSRIIRVVSGDAIAVIIDARKDSEDFGSYTMVHLNPYDSSDELSGKEIYVPAGFTTAVISLKDDTYVQEFRGEKSYKNNVANTDELNPVLRKIIGELTQTDGKIKISKEDGLIDHVQMLPTGLQDCVVIKPNFVSDFGGYQVVDYQDELMHKLGFDEVYQHSESKSAKNVLRGMHFQLDPKCQAKLVRVVKGEVIDVVVDIRKGSKTYGKSYAIRLKPFDPNDPTSGRQLYVPRGFAHGFISLTDDALFQYFVDNSYAPELEEGILWSGEETRSLFESILEENNIRIDDLIINEKDQKRLALKDKPDFFKYKNKKRISI